MERQTTAPPAIAEKISPALTSGGRFEIETIRKFSEGSVGRRRKILDLVDVFREADSVRHAWQ